MSQICRVIAFIACLASMVLLVYLRHPHWALFPAGIGLVMALFVATDGTGVLASVGDEDPPEQ